MKTLSKPFSRQGGVTVIEIMIAVALSLIILAGVMHIFLNNKKTSQVQEAFARLQENGRLAMQLLTDDLRMIGYTGCASQVKSAKVRNIADLAAPKNEKDEVGDFSGNGLQGYEYGDLPIVLSNTSTLEASQVVPNTDIIRIKGGTPTTAQVNDATQNSLNSKLHLTESTASGLFQENDYIFISDCTKADIFVVSEINSQQAGIVTLNHNTTENHDPNSPGSTFLSKVYQSDAQIMKLMSTTYYIGYNTYGEPALFKQTLGNGGTMSAEELVEGVEDMQIFYGRDTTGDGAANIYRHAGEISDDEMEEVVSVRVTLQIRSVTDNLTQEKDKDYEDKRLRRSFTTSVTIRNRVT